MDILEQYRTNDNAWDERWDEKLISSQTDQR